MEKATHLDNFNATQYDPTTYMYFLGYFSWHVWSYPIIHNLKGPSPQRAVFTRSRRKRIGTLYVYKAAQTQYKGI